MKSQANKQKTGQFLTLAFAGGIAAIAVATAGTSPEADPATPHISAQTATVQTTTSSKAFNTVAPADYITCKCIQRKSDGKVICWGHERHPGDPPPGPPARFKCFKDQP